jgi:ABC-type amino acid transport substrate-binding protein
MNSSSSPRKIKHGIRILVASCLVTLSALFSGCQTPANTGDVAASPDVLRIGVAANMPPFVFEQNGELVGIEVDFGLFLANELGREPRFVRMKWGDLIPALQNNKIDIIMAGMNYTQERAAIILLSDPYVRSGQKALVMRQNASKYSFAGLIANTKMFVGAERGTTGEFLVESSFPNAKLRSYSSAEAGAKAVIDGRIELFIHDAPTVLWMAGTYQNKGLSAALPVLTEDFMVWGIGRQSPALLNAVNGILNKWNQDGTTDSILAGWINY